MSKVAKALSEAEYLALKDRLLRKLTQSLEMFVISELRVRDIYDADLIHAQMEVLLDVAASSAVSTTEIDRAEFVAMAGEVFHYVYSTAVRSRS